MTAAARGTVHVDSVFPDCKSLNGFIEQDGNMIEFHTPLLQLEVEHRLGGDIKL